MSTTLTFLLPFALIAVVVILALGLWNMLRNGSSSRSQKLMRARVIMQAVAIVILMSALYFTSK